LKATFAKRANLSSTSALDGNLLRKQKKVKILFYTLALLVATLFAATLEFISQAVFARGILKVICFLIVVSIALLCLAQLGARVVRRHVS
jgi:RsiW-degrading membrane proteinase PrsW (M82 family)